MTEAYTELRERYERIAMLTSATDQLVWDQQVVMPEDGTPARRLQFATLSSVRHKLLTSDQLGTLLEDVQEETLSPPQRAVVRDIERKYERAVDVPLNLVETLNEVQTEAQDTWAQAKRDEDFEKFEPTLERLRELHVKRAQYVNPDIEPYRVLHRDSLPHVSLETVETLFDELKTGLIPLINDIKRNGRELAASPQPGLSTEDRRRVIKRVLTELGYDFERGSLDESLHPFTVGNQFDCRVTMNVNKPLMDSITSAVHEFGHATYQHGLPSEHFGSPLGESLGFGVHESQSRFWENHIGRSRDFWAFLLPELAEVAPELEGVSVQQAYESVNQVCYDNCIRTAADELTYHLHVLVRFEVGRAFIRGNIKAEEIPHLWRERMDEYLGVVPETPSEGPLQDIHWTSWFAAFQEYTVGSLLAAQLAATLREDIPEFDAYIRRGEFRQIRKWMNEHVHQYGRRYSSDTLIKRVTGEPLTAKYFLNYITDKYASLYDLSKR